MKFTGKLKEPIIDFVTHRLTILFEPNEDFRQAYEELKDVNKLILEIKPYRRKRSLDANAYYWVLVGKLAKAIGLSNNEVHNMLLRGYGHPEIFEGKSVYMTIPDTEEAEKKVNNAMDYHLKPIMILKRAASLKTLRNRHREVRLHTAKRTRWHKRLGKS